MKLDILPLDPSQNLGLKLRYEYETASYYEVEVSTELDSWAARLTLRKFPSPIRKDSESELYKPHVEAPAAYRALYDGAEAGWMQVGYEAWNRRLRIWEILLKPEFRGQGVGAQLMEKAKSDAKAAGARMIVLETQSCNVPAIRFYRKQGFQLIGFDLASYTNEDQSRREVRLEFGLAL